MPDRQRGPDGRFLSADCELACQHACAYPGMFNECSLGRGTEHVAAVELAARYYGELIETRALVRQLGEALIVADHYLDMHTQAVVESVAAYRAFLTEGESQEPGEPQ